MKTKKNFLKKLSAVALGFVMTLGVGAAGYAASSNETRADTSPTITKGTNCSDAKMTLNSGTKKDAYKLGTGKATGDLSFTVPATATSFTFYAAGWNGDGTHTVDIYYGNTKQSASLSLTNYSSISGSGTEFSITEADLTKISKTVSVNFSSNTTVKLATSSKRAILWDISYSTSSSVPVSSVGLDKTSLSMSVGDTEVLTATVNPSNATDKTVTWSTDNSSVATVSNGTVTAVAEGTATITASAGGKSATCSVAVSSGGGGGGSGSGYEKITSTDDIENGDYVIAAYVSSSYKAMSNSFASKINGTSVTVTDDIISTSNAENYVVTITGDKDGFSIYNGTSYLIYSSSTNLGTSSSAYNWTAASGTKGTFRINSATSGRCLAFRASSYNQFGGYSTSNITAGGTEYYDVELFKKTGSTPPPADKTIEVSDLTISGATTSVSDQMVGYYQQLTATVTYTEGDNYAEGSGNVTWNTSDSSKATVYNGKVTFHGEGEVTITAETEDTDSSKEKVSKSVTYNVSNLKGSSVAHCFTTAEVMNYFESVVNESKVYVSGIVSKINNNNYYMTDTGIHPSSDKESFEFYNPTADSRTDVAVGWSVVVSGKLKDFNGQKEFDAGCIVESKTAPVQHVLTISGIPSTFYVGDIATLSATCDQDDTGTLTFSSTSTSIAAVSGTTLTAKAEGNTTISATSTCGGTGSLDITVTARTASISPTVSKLDTDSNFTLPITWDNTPSATPTYKWSSSSTTVATIDQTTGEITIKGSGNTTIKCAITVNGVVINTNDCILSVASTSPYINLSQKSAAKWTGQEFTLNVTYGNLVNGLFLYKTNDNISFNLTNDTEHNTATVVVRYLSTAAGASARIRFFDASSQPADITKGYLNEFTANINQSTVTITLDKESATIYSNNPDKNTVQITPTVVGTGCYEDDDATDVSWSSSDTSVATVSSTGLVTAVANGTANITCTSTSDSSVVETCVVTVATYTEPVFEKYTGALKEGYYVICSDAIAMKNSLTSAGRMDYESVTISSDKITDPSVNLIWKLTKEETIGEVDYWSFYNESANKYMAFNGSDGKASLSDTVTDYAKFSFVNGEFVNKEKTTKNNLRYNAGYGFASYATGTGKQNTLYKLPGPEISISSSSETNELVIGLSATLTIEKLNGATGTVNWFVTSTPDDITSDTPVVTLSSETGDSVTVTGNIHGTAVVTASLTGCESQTVSFTVGRKLSGLEIDASQVETSYKEGDYFDPTGLVVKNVFDNGDEETTSAWDYDIKRTLISSDTEIIISSTSDSSISCSLSITVAKNYDFDTNSQISLVDYKYEPSTHVDPTTISTTILETFGDNIPDNGEKVLNINLGGGIVATASDGTNNGKVYADGTEWRFYQNNSGTLTLTAPEGKTIGSFTITYSVSNTGIPLYDGKSFASGEEVDVNSLNSCVISIGNSGSATNGRVDVKAIEVVLDGEDTPAEVTLMNSASLRAFVTISKDTFEEVFENPSDWEFGFMIVETGDLKDGMSFVSSASELGDDSTPSEVALNAITSTKAKVNMYSEDELPLYNDSYYEFGLNLRLKPSQFNLNFTIAWFAHNTVTGEYVFATAIDSSIYEEAVKTDTSSMDEGQIAVINYIIERYSKN